MIKPAIFSFFSGSGFLDLGFEHSDFDIQFVNEYHKPFLDAYRYMREQMSLDIPKYGFDMDNIESFKEEEKCRYIQSLIKNAKCSSNMVGFIGGPPCPDFSIGGKNKGKSGNNGVLSALYIHLILTLEPDFFIFENVKGLWRTKKHRSFYDELKTKIINAHYSVTDQLINCIEFGVPQNRERIIMFGVHQRILDSTKKDFSLSNKFNWNSHKVYNKIEVLNKSLWPSQEKYEEGSQKEMPLSVENLSELSVEHWFRKNDVDNHPNSQHHFKPRAGLVKFQTIPEGDDTKKSYKRLHRWRYSPTAAYGNNEVHLHPYKSRRISAAEALAIQSLPANFHLPQDMSLSNMFKTIGNGVPYLASLGIAKTVNEFLRNLKL